MGPFLRYLGQMSESGFVQNVLAAALGESPAPVSYGQFGFQVHKPGEPGTVWAAVEDWAICLPHQCDNWEIAGHPDLAVFLERAQRFRAELNSAVRQLEKAAGVRECGSRCGAWVRPVQPEDGVDGYGLVHLDGNPICDGPAVAC